MADDTGADAHVVQIMTDTAQRVLARERAYDVAKHAMGALVHLLAHARHGGAAYKLWASISDLFDDPRGPASEEICDVYADAVAVDWLSVDTSSREAVAAYFKKWDPASGSAWRSLLSSRSN